MLKLSFSCLFHIIVKIVIEKYVIVNVQLVELSLFEEWY